MSRTATTATRSWTVRVDGSDAQAVNIPELPLETYSELYGIDWTALQT
jgi:hypothetical protein